MRKATVVSTAVVRSRSRKTAIVAVSLAVILVFLALPATLHSQSRTVAADPAAWNRNLELGPVHGLTTVWHPAPMHTAVPLGIMVQLRVKAPGSAFVTWLGARETTRDAGRSMAELRADTVGIFPVIVRVDNLGEVVEETSVFEVIDTSKRPLTVSAIHLHADDMVIDPTHHNASTMHYYFLGSSIARLRQTGPESYRTSTNRRLVVRADVDPPGLAPLIEWRLDDVPQHQLGSTIELQLFTAGVHTIAAGPAATAREVTLETYMVRITNPEMIHQVATGVPVTFTAATDPPGYEDEVTWLASTKLGSCTPATGEGKSFTTIFNNALHRSGSWLGVKADGAKLGIDPKGPPCISRGSFLLPTALLPDSSILGGRFECTSASCSVELQGVGSAGAPVGTVQLEKCEPLTGSFDCIRSVLQLPSGENVTLTLRPTGATRTHSLKRCTGGATVPACSEFSVVSMCDESCEPVAWAVDGQTVSEEVFQERLLTLLNTSPEAGIPLQVIPRIASQVSPDVEILARLAPALLPGGQAGTCGAPGPADPSGLIDCYEDAAKLCGCQATGKTCTSISVSCPSKGTTGCFVIVGTGCGVASPFETFGCLFANLFG